LSFLLLSTSHGSGRAAVQLKILVALAALAMPILCFRQLPGFLDQHPQSGDHEDPG
jgi:hypothetical protein